MLVMAKLKTGSSGSAHLQPFHDASPLELFVAQLLIRAFTVTLSERTVVDAEAEAAVESSARNMGASALAKLMP